MTTTLNTPTDTFSHRRLGVEKMSVGLCTMVVMDTIYLDCHGCRAAASACQDCVFSVILQPTDAPLTPGEVWAVTNLADSGLVPPLRHEASRPELTPLVGEPVVAVPLTRIS